MPRPGDNPPSSLRLGGERLVLDLAAAADGDFDRALVADAALLAVELGAHSSSWPSLTMASKILLTMVPTFSGSGRARERAAASHESASIMMAASLNCGLGPG